MCCFGKYDFVNKTEIYYWDNLTEHAICKLMRFLEKKIFVIHKELKTENSFLNTQGNI